MIATGINTEITQEYASRAVEAVLEVLGSPATDVQKTALEAFHSGDAATIKRLSVMNLSDNYLKCLGYLISVSKLTAQTDTILAESCRSAADHVRDKILNYLGGVIIGNG